MKKSRSKGRYKCHGQAYSSEYRAWTNAKRRCTHPIMDGYEDYGGRGITVWHGWLNDFPAFLAHVGPKPSPKHSLDRINNERGYEPGNVRWATRAEQNRNSRRNVLVTIDGRTQTAQDWSQELGIHSQTFKYRLLHGWPSDQLTALPKKS